MRFVFMLGLGTLFDTVDAVELVGTVDTVLLLSSLFFQIDCFFEGRAASVSRHMGASTVGAVWVSAIIWAVPHSVVSTTSEARLLFSLTFPVMVAIALAPKTLNHLWVCLIIDNFEGLVVHDKF